MEIQLKCEAIDVDELFMRYNTFNVEVEEEIKVHGSNPDLLAALRIKYNAIEKELLSHGQGKSIGMYCPIFC